VRMRTRITVGLGLLLMLTVVAASVVSTAQDLAFAVYLPIIRKDATPTATATLRPTATLPPPPTNTPVPSPAEVVISYIDYDGQVPRVESDEYAEIANAGSDPVNIGGWRLNAGDPGQDFIFPSFDLQAGQTCRVYTNEIHPEYCGFSFGSGTAIWSNSGDCGYLYDAEGTLVDDYCY
jgi:hypothetical protein